MAAGSNLEEVVIVNLQLENDRIARQLRDVLPEGCRVRQMPVLLGEPLDLIVELAGDVLVVTLLRGDE
jgi:hypothetical protein